MRSAVPRVSLPVVAILGGALAGCASPREKDCKAVMPLVEESRSTRVAGVADGGLLQPAFAERPRRTASALRALPLNDPAMKPAVHALADANDRFAASMAALDRLVAAMKMRPGTPSPIGANVFDVARPSVERLMKRCGLVTRTPQQRALPDCVALERALEQCVTPATDDTTVEEQLLTCATAVGNVHSDDASTTEAILQLAATLRDLEPAARNVGAPAKEVIVAARQHAGEISKQSAARGDVEHAEGIIRGLCKPAGGRP